jgi:hypothetical protein
MRDTELLQALLACETEDAVIKVLESRKLLEDMSRWPYLGRMPNNQSIVLNQQSSAAAALVEKFTNAQDALLMRYCKAAGIDPRSAAAPASMADAVEQFLGSTAEAFTNPEDETKARDARRAYAEDNLVLYATGTKSRPSLSLYDAGEGQLAKDFPTTFCSLIYGDASGSYKGAINFVQGRFNMGGSGVLPFCSEKHKMQLIVSRVPKDVAGGDDHEWAFTLICFFPSKQSPSWHYLLGTDGQVMTAGKEPLGLLPRANVKSGELTPPRQRKVASGTLIKMYDFKAPLSNICGELYRKIEEFLLRPPLPLRLVECRPEYKANVMRNTVWDRLAIWKDKMEPGFENGASVSVELETGETIPVEIRVFKAQKNKDGEMQDDPDRLQTGLRAVINGQSHAKRDSQFFKTQAVDKEHIAGSMLVLLDCTSLSQPSRNAIFMSNRETFREDPLLHDLFKKVQRELKDHEGLKELNKKRYEEKVKDAVNDDDGVKALEELLATDPDLADLFGTMKPGKAGAKILTDGPDGLIDEPPKPFKGTQFPTYFKRKDKDGATSVEAEIEKGDLGRVSFVTDVRNDYFTRKHHVGKASFSGDIVPTARLFNGRYTLTFAPDKKVPVGTKLSCKVTITDNKGSGPFVLDVHITIAQPTVKPAPQERPPRPPKALAAPSRPDIQEVNNGPDAAPLTILEIPNTERLKLLLNVDSNLLAQAKGMRPKEEASAVEFVFKYGLALTAMGLIDAAKKTDDWKNDPAACRARIEETAKGLARVIVPLCLSLPSKLPKTKTKLAVAA